jgi:DNA-binding MarR family transcriptional regulator
MSERKRAHHVKRRRIKGGPASDDDFIIEENVGYLIAVAARYMARSLNRRLLKHGVSVGQWTVLLHLWASDGLSQRELSRRIGIEDATITRTIDRMERDGLVQRIKEPHDQRQYRITITARARALRDHLVPCALDVVDVVIADLSRADVQRLCLVLHKIIARGRADNLLTDGSN